MNIEFDAEGLVARLLLGEIDDDLTEEVRKLSVPQLKEVVSLLETLPETDTEDHIPLLISLRTRLAAGSPHTGYPF